MFANGPVSQSSYFKGDVSKVTLVATAITGESFTAMAHGPGVTWMLELINNAGAAAGEYSLRIIADSTNSPGVPLYDFVTVLISESAIINVTGISPDIGNAGYEYPGVEIGGEGFHGPLAQVLLQMAGQDDIPATNVNVVDPGLITCDLELPIVAELGLWDVKVINDGGPFGIGPELFEITAVTPEVTAIDPDNAYPNQPLVGATIFGGFFQGPGAQVKLKKTGQDDVIAENVVVDDENHITYDLQIPFDATQGGFAYVVTQDGGTLEKKVQIIDIWPPNSASLLTTIDLKSWPEGVDINGNILYVAESSGLRIFELW